MYFLITVEDIQVCFRRLVCDIYSAVVLTCQTHYHHNRMLNLTFVWSVSFSADRDVVLVLATRIFLIQGVILS